MRRADARLELCAQAAAALVVGASARASAEPRVEMRTVSLAQAVAEARAHNPTAEIAENQIRRAEALVEQARSSSLPTLTGNAVYTRLDADRVLSGRVIAAADQRSANLVLAVPLIVPRQWLQWSHASDQVTVTVANTAEIKRQLALSVARAYLAVVGQRRIVDASVHGRDAARAHFDFAHTRYAGGVGNRLDEIRAGQELAVSEAQLQSTELGLARAREALSVLVGASGPVDAREDVALSTPASREAALSDAETRRNDIVTLREREAAAHRVVRDSWTEFVPYLTGILQPFYQDPPSLTQPQTGWQAQLLLTLPLYDGGLRYGLLHERQAVEREARLTLEGALRQARSDVRIALTAIERADAALESAREAARLAQDSLALATAAYRAGATTNIEVIDAERRARDADTQAAVAEDNAREARLELLAASGRFP